MDNYDSAIERSYDYYDDSSSSKLLYYAYNASTMVTSFGLAFAVLLYISAMSVLVYYYINDATSNRRSFNSRSDSKGEQRSDDSPIVDSGRVLLELERAYALYGISRDERDCRVKMACQAFTVANASKKQALVISTAIRKLVPEVTSKLTGAEVIESNELLSAANIGQHTQDCSSYGSSCPHRQLPYLHPQLDDHDDTKL